MFEAIRAVHFLLLILLGGVFGVFGVFGVIFLVVVLVNLSLVVVLVNLIRSSLGRLLGNLTLCVLLREGFFNLLVVLRLPRQILSQILEVVILVVMRHRIRIRIAVAVAVVKDSVRRRCVVGLTPCCVKRDLVDLVRDLG